MNHIYRALTFILCFMVFNSWANTPTFEEALFTTCADRTASNTKRCMDDSYLNTQYGGYVLFEGLENHYTLQNGRLQEFLDGTARLTGRWVNIGRSDVKFDIDIRLSGRTTTATSEPKDHRCLDVDPSGWYYYANTSGTITGRDKAAGAKLEVSRFGPAFQFGIGANVTNADLNMGACGWLAINMISNTNTDLNLVLQTSSAGGNGDININLDGSPTACFESRISLDCPTDLSTVAEFGSNGKIVNWNAPTATTTCTVGRGTSCSSTNLNGFEYLGEFEGSRYYCSERNTHTWLEARNLAISAGGHLAVVCSAAENEFLRNGLLNHDAWIGYNDYGREGVFNWADGSDCSYTNWRAGEPNNYGGDEDFARILKENGKWTDRNVHYETEFIMEIPCEGGMEPGEVVTTQIAGPTPGSIFPIGMTTVTYESVDECGNTERCSFKVTVEEDVDPCLGNGSPIVDVEVTDPECGEDNGKIKFTFSDNTGRTNIEFSRDGGQSFDLNVSDNTGMAMYADLAPGTYSVAVRWGNDDCPVDLGTVTLDDVRVAAGTQCNDGNANTINDVIAADGCTCEGIPAGAISLVCEDDILVVTDFGDNGAIVTFDAPNASTTCGLSGLEVEQVEGPASGSRFPFGTTVVKYVVTDACDNMEMCSFEVIVEEGADPCLGNGSPIVEVEGTDPECGEANGKIVFTFGDNAGRTGIEFSRDGGQTFDLNSADNAGMAMYADLAPGTYSVAVRWGNDDCPVDLGTVTLDDIRQAPGTECNDGNSSTLNDVIAADGCTCEGIPAGAISLTCEDDITVVAGPGEDGVIVIFDEPTASTTCGLNGLDVERVEGPASGSLFPVGTTTVKYVVTDACDNMEMCSFVVVVEETPLTLDIDCVDNIEVTAAVGEEGAIVTFNNPSIDTNCPADGFTVTITEGLESGSLFPIGSTTVTFEVEDGCDQVEECSIIVKVNPAPTGDITFDCNDDIEVTAAVGSNNSVVTYTTPTAQTTCSLDGLSVARIAGLASGATFPVGTTTITYEATDACGEEATCTFDVVVNPAPTGDITFDCNDDIEVTAAVGSNSSVVTYTTPTAQTTCSLDGLAVVRTAGPASGATFPVGTTTVTYEATDACGEEATCTFDVVVNPAPTGDITFACNDDITIAAAPGANSAVVTYTIPTAQTTCSLDGLAVVRIAGLASGVAFPVGTTTVTYEATDACGEEATCTFDITVTPTDLPKGSIGDLVFLDVDQDGIQDDDEIGIGNVTVKLQDPQGNTIATDITENDGSYLFEDVDAGDYKIMVNTPDGLVLSPADAGNNDDNDSDILANGMTEVFTLAPGADIDNIDAGLFVPEAPKAKVGDIVFLDSNGNGIQDDDELGIQNIVVFLYDGTGNQLAFATTDENGMYMFGDLEPGDYRLKFVGQDDDLIATIQDEGNDDGVDSDIDSEGYTEVFTLVTGYDDSRDAGFTPRDIQPDPARIGNQVFLDANENGVKDDGEAGIDGVEVKLLSADGDVLQTTTTGNNGMYNFSVDAGTYMVMFGTPTGFNPTNQSGNAADGIDNDSDSNPATGMTGMITVAAGDANPTIDAGFVAEPVGPGPVNCDEVTASVEDGKIIVQSLNGSKAKVEVIGRGTNWTPLLICGDGADACGTMTMISDLPEGDYTVKIQLWGTDGSYCYTQRDVTVDGGTPTCTVDGGTISTSDDITDLCVNDGEASIVNFAVSGSNGPNSAWVVTKEDGTILNPDAPSSVDFEGAGTGTCKIYYVRYENVEGLVAGANINDLTGCFDKSNSISVTRTEDCGTPTCTVDGGTISTSDDITDLCVNDGEASIVNFAVSGSNGPNSAWVVTKEDGTILNPDAPSSVDFEGAGTGTCKVYYVSYENIDGLVAGANIDDLTGCFDKSNSISVTRTEDCDGTGEPICDDVTVTTGNGKINLVGLSAPFVVVKIHDINDGWTIIDECYGCEDPTTFNVPEGDYNVVIEFYRGFWNDKYCRRDVTVTVGEDSTPVDSDRDGIPADDDCDDTDASVGAKQAPGTSCDDGNDATINDVILADGCGCAGEEDNTPVKEICAERDVFNTDNCQFNIIYGLYLKLEGYDEYYGVRDASFIEYTDGTALFTATAINNTSPNIGWEIEVMYGGRTTLAEVAPKQHNCLTANVDDFYFYETLEGKLTGINDAAGASMNVMRIGPAFQLGVAANITHNAYDFGGSGWFVADMLTQPTSGLEIILNEGAQGQNGDFNINLSGDGTECIEGRDNSELDCGNVSAIATADGITINGLTAPIEIVKVFDTNWATVGECTGDCGESMSVDAIPGNYKVRVIFYTANWQEECSVDIDVTVPASANSASSRNAPQLNMHTFENNRAVTVEWLTNTGYMNDSYVIEKSIDGNTFEAMDEVANKDNSDELAYYKGVDAQPTLGANYYRVKQIYVDGSFDYSDVQLVNFNLDLQTLAVFPNPAREELFVSLKAHAGQTANLQIINNFGQVVRQLEIDEIPTEAIRLDLGDVQNGMYHLSIRVDKSNIITKKILVNRLY